MVSLDFAAGGLRFLWVASGDLREPLILPLGTFKTPFRVARESAGMALKSPGENWTSFHIGGESCGFSRVAAR